MKNKGKYIKDFALRGMIAMGFGPIVLAVVYGILGLTGVVESINVYEMVIGIVTITALAFLCGGITIVYQIEELPLAAAITLHGISLYIVYLVVYLVNGWFKDGAISFLVFTIIFIVGYALVWIVIYFVTRIRTNNINKKLKN